MEKTMAPFISITTMKLFPARVDGPLMTLIKLIFTE